MSKLTVIVPALNEEATIKEVVESIKSLPIKPKVLVVDNSSSDNTAELAEEAGARVINVVTRGKGNAVKEALKYVDTPYVGMIDGDGTYPVVMFLSLYAAMGQYDVAKMQRKWYKDGAMSGMHKLGNLVFSTMSSILYGRRVQDVCSGMWVFKKECLDKFNITSAGFTLEVDLFTNVALKGYRMAEYPSFYFARPDGSRSKLKPFDAIRVALFLITRRLKGV